MMWRGSRRGLTTVCIPEICSNANARAWFMIAKTKSYLDSKPTLCRSVNPKLCRTVELVLAWRRFHFGEKPGYSTVYGWLLVTVVFMSDYRVLLFHLYQPVQGLETCAPILLYDPNIT